MSDRAAVYAVTQYGRARATTDGGRAAAQQRLSAARGWADMPGSGADSGSASIARKSDSVVVIEGNTALRRLVRRHGIQNGE